MRKFETACLVIGILAIIGFGLGAGGDWPVDFSRRGTIRPSTSFPFTLWKGTFDGRAPRADPLDRICDEGDLDDTSLRMFCKTLKPTRAVIIAGAIFSTFCAVIAGCFVFVPSSDNTIPRHLMTVLFFVTGALGVVGMSLGIVTFEFLVTFMGDSGGFTDIDSWGYGLVGTVIGAALAWIGAFLSWLRTPPSSAASFTSRGDTAYASFGSQ